MTLQEAIMDKNRPLSVTPQEWMQYELAEQQDDKQIYDESVKRIIASEQKIQDQEQISDIQVDSQDKLQIGIQQMILGCRISMRALQELDRKNLSPNDRIIYSSIKDLIDNAIAPYLGDILKQRKRLYNNGD